MVEVELIKRKEPRQIAKGKLRNQNRIHKGLIINKAGWLRPSFYTINKEKESISSFLSYIFHTQGICGSIALPHNEALREGLKGEPAK